jgi:hypothetical protein
LKEDVLAIGGKEIQLKLWLEAPHLEVRGTVQGMIKLQGIHRSFCLYWSLSIMWGKTLNGFMVKSCVFALLSV